MKKRNWIVLVLVLALALPLAACKPSSGKPIELVIYSQLANSSGDQGGWAAEILMEKFNVKVTIISDAVDGTFATRMAGGNLGDIVIFGSDGNQYQEAVEAGMLMDWEADDLLAEFGPYINENMQLALEKNRDMNKGTIYGFGHDVAGSTDDHDAHIYYPYLRWDLYAALGYPAINTLEDFIPVLEAMQALEPLNDNGTKTYGVSSFPDWDGDMVMMVKSTGALYGFEEFGMGLYHVTDQYFQGALDEAGMYLRCLKFYNTLYQKGLFDPDSMTQTFDDAAKKYKNGTSFWNIFTFVAETYNTAEHMDAGKAMQCVAAADQTNVAAGLNLFGKNRVWSIGAKSNYPEKCMEIINWLCTPEGVMTYNYGPKGVNWDYDEAGEPYLTELGLACRADKKTVVTYGESTDAYENGEFQHNNTTWSIDATNPESAAGENFNYKTWNNTLLSSPVTAIEQSWRDYMNSTKADEYLDKNGHLAVAVGTKYAQPKRGAELETTWEQVKMCIRAGSWSAIYANSDAEYDAIVAQMISDAYAYGYGECVEWSETETTARIAAENAVK